MRNRPAVLAALGIVCGLLVPVPMDGQIRRLIEVDDYIHPQSRKLSTVDSVAPEGRDSTARYFGLAMSRVFAGTVMNEIRRNIVGDGSQGFLRGVANYYYGKVQFGPAITQYRSLDGGEFIRDRFGLRAARYFSDQGFGSDRILLDVEVERDSGVAGTMRSHAALQFEKRFQFKDEDDFTGAYRLEVGEGRSPGLALNVSAPLSMGDDAYFLSAGGLAYSAKRFSISYPSLGFAKRIARFDMWVHVDAAFHWRVGRPKNTHRYETAIYVDYGALTHMLRPQ